MDRPDVLIPDDGHGHKPFADTIRRLEESIGYAKEIGTTIAEGLPRVEGEEKEMFKYALERCAENIQSVIELETFVQDLKERKITRFCVERIYWLSAYLLGSAAFFDGMFNDEWKDLVDLYIESRQFAEEVGTDLKSIAEELEKYLDPIPAISPKDDVARPQTREIDVRQFPPGSTWEDVIIRFLDDESVFIAVKDTQFETTFDAMGFKDKRRNRPNAQWRLLMGLAVHGGELSWRNNHDLESKNVVDKVKKQKQLLSRILKQYFPFEGDPFLEYRKVKAYRIKIKLTPSPNIISALSHKKKDPEDENDDPLGINDAYSSQARSVYLDEQPFESDQ